MQLLIWGRMVLTTAHMICTRLFPTLSLLKGCIYCHFRQDVRRLHDQWPSWYGKVLVFARAHPEHCGTQFRCLCLLMGQCYYLHMTTHCCCTSLLLSAVCIGWTDLWHRNYQQPRPAKQHQDWRYWVGVSVRFVLLFVDYTCSSHARILPNHLEHWLEE